MSASARRISFRRMDGRWKRSRRLRSSLSGCGASACSMNATADEDQQANVTAFLQVLQQLGWTDGCNVRIEFRWGEGNAEQYRKIAAELVALGPDVIVALGTLAVGALQRTSRKRADRIRQWQVVQTDQSSGPRPSRRCPSSV
jgi:hypothetical protein